MPWFANICVCCTVQRLGIAIICALVSRRKPSQTKGMVSILFLCAFVGQKQKTERFILGSFLDCGFYSKSSSFPKKKSFFPRGSNSGNFSSTPDTLEQFRRENHHHILGGAANHIEQNVEIFQLITVQENAHTTAVLDCQ